MGAIIKKAASCSIRYYICAIITFFVYFSLTVVATGFFTEVNGYTAYDAEKNEVLYHYYYEQGEDTLLAEYQAKGIEVSTVALRSTLQGGGKVFVDATGQLIGGLITGAFIYTSLWKLGDGDANLVAFGNAKHDSIKGLKIGALAVVPSFISWIIVVLAKTGAVPGGWFALYRFMNYQLFTLVNAIFGQSVNTTDMISWPQIFAGLSVLVFVPLVAQISYMLGFKRISLGESLIYKKNDNRRK